MRITTYCHSYLPHVGGVETIVAGLSRSQVAAGHAVHIVSTAWSGTSGLEVGGELSVRRLPALHFTERFGVPFPMPLGPGVLAALSHGSRADVHHVHGCLYPTSVLGYRAARQVGKPLVITEHVGFVPYRRRLLEWLQSAAWRVIGDRVLRGADTIVVYNERVRRWVERRAAGCRVRSIPNGIDVQLFRPPQGDEVQEARARFALPKTGVLGLFVGRTAAKKNLEAMLRVARDAFHLVCCGAHRRLPPDVLDLGVVRYSEMHALYRAVDFFVHLGTGEGFPVAAQEAAASRLPLLMLWDEGYEGTVRRDEIYAIDSLHQLNSACRTLSSSESRRRHLGERARERAVASWSWEQTRIAYDAVYEQAVRRAAIRPGGRG